MKIACAEFIPTFGDAGANAERICEITSVSAADLIVFPEAALTGYCVSSDAEAKQISIPSTHASLQQIERLLVDQGSYAIVGFAELDGEKVFNSAALFGPNGRIGIYRKTHIPFLGIDRFVTAGCDAPIFETPFGNVAIAICFDIRFPELARSYALRGADLICVPTNWPEGAQPSSDYICPARAVENHVFIAAANRAGEENGFRFIGKSKIIAPSGKILASAEHDQETVIEAECDLFEARSKRVVQKPGEYEMDLWNARRPELYGTLTANS